MIISVRRPLLHAVVGLGFGACVPAPQPPTVAPAGNALLLQRVRIFDPANGSFSDTLDMLIRNDRISAIGRLGHQAKGTAILDAQGLGVTSPADIDTTLDRLVARGASMIKAIDYWDPILFRHLLKAAQARSIRSRSIPHSRSA